MFHLIRDKLKASSLSKKAAGPFLPDFFEALKNNTCMRCGGPISDIEMFGNGLVVEPQRVVLNCRRCRVNIINYDKHWIGKCDVDGIIYQIHQHKNYATGESLSWQRVLECLRAIDPAHITSKGSDPEEFFWDGHPRRKLFHHYVGHYWGKLLTVSNCQDCHAYWREFDGNPNTTPTFEEWSDTECYGCGVKHEDQFHMRMPIEEEQQILFGWDKARYD